MYSTHMCNIHRNSAYFICAVALNVIHSITTHLLSIEFADWPKLHGHDMFKALNAKKRATLISGGISGQSLCLEFVFHDVLFV